MSYSKKKKAEGILPAIYIALQGIAFLFVWLRYYNVNLKKEYLFKGNALMVFLYMIIMLFICQSLHALKVGTNGKYELVVSHVLSSIITNFILFAILIIAFRGFTNPRYILYLLCLNFAVSVVWIFASKFILSKFKARRCVLFYYDEDPDYLINKYEQREDQFVIEKMVQIRSADSIKNSLYEGENFDCAVIAYMPSKLRNEVLKLCFKKDLEIVVAPKVSDVLLRGAKELNIFDQPLYVIDSNAIKGIQGFVKRCFDILFSFFVLLLTSPIMLATAIAIKAEDGGPVFYKQKRCTLNEREFEIIKFRSMIVNAEKNSHAVLASKNDSRITKIGKFIRATRIDELPQFFNIIKGDMSVVGPRPERKELIEKYSDYVEAFPYRTKVKAGLTGYAQLMGKYNSNPYNKLLFDLMYVQKFSLVLDARLILLTMKIVFIKDSTEGVDEEFNRFLESFEKAKEKDIP